MVSNKMLKNLIGIFKSARFNSLLPFFEIQNFENPQLNIKQIMILIVKLI